MGRKKLSLRTFIFLVSSILFITSAAMSLSVDLRDGRPFDNQQQDSVLLTGYNPENSLRVHFNTDYFTTSQQYPFLCYNQGDDYVVGTPPHGDQICGSVISNCHGKCKRTDIINDYVRQVVLEETLPQLQKSLSSMFSLRGRREEDFLNITKRTCTGEDGTVFELFDLLSSEKRSYRVLSNVDLYVVVVPGPIIEDRKYSWSVECQKDEQTDRPLVALFNLGPIIVSRTQRIREALVLHEMFHILGFAFQKFNQYRDDNGDLRTNVLVTETRSHLGDDEEITYISLPKVVQTARQYFQCDSITRIELENHAFPFRTRRNHWEKRIFLNEIMNGDIGSQQVGDGPILSTFTLAVLEDSGWYHANYSMASELNYAKGMGCAFLNQRCSQWGDKRYFCGDVDISKQCTYDYNQKASCNLAHFSTDLRAYYQNFESPNLGGLDPYADRCPYFIPQSTGDCRDPSRLDTTVAERTGEFRGLHAKCIVGNTYRLSATLPDPSSRCYETACDSGETLYIRVGLNWVKCPKEGGTVENIPAMNGMIECPPVYHICPQGYTSSNFNENVSDPNKNNNFGDWIQHAFEELQRIPHTVWIITISMLFISCAICIVGFIIYIIRWCVIKHKKKLKVVDAT